MPEEKPLIKGGAHTALINDQVKWSPHPDSNKSEHVFWINFDIFITKDELLKVFVEHYGLCQDWRILKR